MAEDVNIASHTLMWQSDWCMIHSIMWQSDWCVIHTQSLPSDWYKRHTTLYTNIVDFFIKK